MSVKDNRYRNFATVIYTDSAPLDFQSLISSLHIPCFLSPYHDKDFNPDGEPKKPHYHLLLMFEGKKSISQVQDLLSNISTVPVEIVDSLRGYARYLCHLDNPEKAQYDIELVRSFTGADYNAIIGLATDKYKAVGEMIAFVDEHAISAFSDLLRYASQERYDWFRALCDNSTVVMKEYIRSECWKREHGFSTPLPNDLKLFDNSVPENLPIK